MKFSSFFLELLKNIGNFGAEIKKNHVSGDPGAVGGRGETCPRHPPQATTATIKTHNPKWVIQEK
jgi:hypothetical protein